MLDSKQVYDYLIRIQAIAKIGLKYSKDPYALTNYKEINDLTLKMLEEFMDVKFDRPNYFIKDTYPTPNVSVRTVILNKDRTKVLLVREVSTHTYSFPGGWADLYDSPSDTAKNESMQEAGATLDNIKLVGVTNRTPFKSDVSVPEYVIIFSANLSGDLQEHEYETDDVNWFDINNLPEISRKVSKTEFERMLFAAINNEVIFD